jgi:tRNA threonylcarbamoyladenosine dehydratase
MVCSPIMIDSFSRSELLLGSEAIERLRNSRVAVFGLGGVGSWAAEALARSGIGALALVDDDAVCVSNINRQLVATRETVGRPKVGVMRERVLAINPEARVEVFQEFYSAENAERLLPAGLDYVIDAIDTVSSKIDLIVRCTARGIPIISALGAGNKLDPTRFEVADIYQTSVCPLARVMRQELKKRGVESLKVVYSREAPIKVNEAANPCRSGCVCPKKDRTCVGRRSVPGSVPFVPPVMGFILAAEAVKDLTGRSKDLTAGVARV